jgi:2-polyprenyl-3-methyl-5-hydroxy-6-metoxy-1,4-benzoquinol methylase
MEKSDGLDYQSKPEDYYENSRPEMLAYLPGNAKTVLDVGCSNGAFAFAIKQKNKAELWGIEPMTTFANQATKKIDKVLNCSIEDALKDLPDNYFDAIYFNDILEHLIDPYSTLEDIKSKLKTDGKIISSIPNIRYFRTFFKLIFKGEWTYQDRGILDRTHLRFFTKKSIIDMYENAGYIIEKHEGLKPSKSLRPFLFNIPLLFKSMDIKFMQFATVASKK